MTPASPGKVVSGSTPRCVEACSAPEGGGASRGGGEGEEAAGAAAPGGGDGRAASEATSSLPETGETSSVAEAGGGGGGTDGEEQGSEGGVSRDESATQRDNQLGAGDAAGDETSKPEEAAATGAPAPPRPKNPNDLVRLFMSESGGGSNGRAHPVGGGGDGGRIVDSQSAAASAPADIGGGNNSADGGNGTDNDSEDGHVDVDGDADADAQQHVPAARDEQEEGQGHEGQHWADGSSVGGGGDSDGESKFGGGETDRQTDHIVCCGREATVILLLKLLVAGLAKLVRWPCRHDDRLRTFNRKMHQVGCLIFSTALSSWHLGYAFELALGVGLCFETRWYPRSPALAWGTFGRERIMPRAGPNRIMDMIHMELAATRAEIIKFDRDRQS